MRRHSICLTAALASVCFLNHPISANADAAAEQATDLPGLARAAKDHFAAISDANVAAARSNLQKVVARLNQFLGNGANGQAWATYLQLGDLQAQMKAGEAPNLDTLKAVQAKFAADQPGLEMPVFSNVRSALDTFIELREASGNAEAKTQYESTADGLAAALENYAKKPSDTDAQTINDALAQLRASHQSPDLIKAVHDKYMRPNIWVQASTDLVGAGINRTLDEKSKVNDNILGADIEGTAHTTGALTTQLVPNEKKAVIQTVLVGKAESDTVGYKGPASVYTKGVTNFQGRQVMTIDADGIKVESPCAHAETHSTITGVCTNSCGMIQKFATKTAYKKKPIGEEIAAGHAEERVRHRIEEESGPAVARANKDYMEKFRNPLVRNGAFPELMRFSTTSSDLNITATAVKGWQIAAPSDPPAVDGSYAMSARVHESAANNLASTVLSNRTITDESVQADAMKIWGKVPDELKLEADAEPWSMTFAAQHPVTLSVMDGGFKIIVRGQRYTSGDRKFQAMNVAATYKIERSGKAMKAVRQGDLEILPPGYTAGQRLSNQQVALRALLQKRFGKLLKPEMIAEGVQLKGKWESYGKLILTQLAASDSGWLSLGWQKDDAAVASLVEAIDDLADLDQD